VPHIAAPYSGLTALVLLAPWMLRPLRASIDARIARLKRGWTGQSKRLPLGFHCLDGTILSLVLHVSPFS
jgi:hypothetical protein